MAEKNWKLMSTKSGKIEVGSRNAVFYRQELENDMTGWTIKRADAIKVVTDSKDASMFVGVRKVNLAVKKKQGFYEKVNEMLGGN